MTPEQESLQKIPEGKPVRVFLPIIDSKERFRASCVFHYIGGLNFNLNFKAGALPENAVEVGKSAIINVDLGGPNISLEAKIISNPSPQQLEMEAEATINHEQMRDFFRVDATTQILSTALKSTIFGNKKTDDWEIPGETIDISGSGILAVFPEKLPESNQIKLQVTIPDDEPPITILAHQVRSHKLDDNRWEVAFRFDDIDIEARDRIVGYCFTIQRQLLRLKVQVKNPN